MIAAVCEHLWQSTLYAGFAWALTVALRDHRASLRHWVWLSASVKFLIPFSLLTSLGAALELDPDAGTRQAVASAVTVFAPLSSSTSGETLVGPDAIGVWTALVYCWLGGTVLLSLRWLRAWVRARAVLRSATLLAFDAPAPVMTTREPLPPGVFGVLRPVILLPQAVIERLPGEQLHAIIAHESCHIERRDNLKASVHMLVETVLWFHPLVWWIGSRLLEERERACDEAVIEIGHRPACYAAGVLSVCRSFHRRELLAAAASGGDLKKRIDGILSARTPAELTRSQRTVLSLLALLTIAAPIAAGATTATRRAESSPHPETLVLASPAQRGEARRIHLVTGNLRDLIALAYGAHVSQIRGDAGWLSARTYRLEVAASVDPTSYRRLLTELLAERFNLQIYLNRDCQQPCGRAEQQIAATPERPWEERAIMPVRF